MAKTKLQKKKIIEDLKQNLINQKAVVFIDFQGLDTKTLFEIRNKLCFVAFCVKVCHLLCLLIYSRLFDQLLKKCFKISACNGRFLSFIGNLKREL